MSKEKKVLVPDLPYGLKISDISKDGIEFYWKKLAIADGYEVFRGYDLNGPFELIFTATRRTIGTYRDNDFDHTKKEVFYSVRSFIRGNNDENVYSVMVPPVSARYIDDLKFDRSVTYLYDGVSRKLKAVFGWGEPEDGIWKSSNENVATVDQSGLITGIATGSCEIHYASKSAGSEVISKVVVNRSADPMLHRFPVRFTYNHEQCFWENPNAQKTDTAIVMMVGDLMCGKMQMNTQYSDKKGWDFCDSFEYVREITKESDLAVANLETLLAPGWPYMTDEVYIDNYNNCNATSRYLEAVRYGGFDAVVMANNHNCDGGIRALQETIDQTDRYDFIHTGVFKNPGDKRFFIVNVNGIKIGFLAYMSKNTGFNGKDVTWTENEKEMFLNIFSEEKAHQDIDDCKKLGAEYIIVYMHWGKKNFRTITEEQRKEAKAAADAGADYIIGANPHLVQIYDQLMTSDGREVPCFYSVGNFQAVMNQVHGNRDSVLVKICLIRDAFGKIRLMKNEYIPFHTYRKIKISNWAPIALSDHYHCSLIKPEKEKWRNYIIETIGKRITPIE